MQPEKTHRARTYGLLGLLALIIPIIVAITACGSATKVATNTPGGSNGAAAAATGAPKVAAQKMAIGQGATISKAGKPALEVTLEGARWGVGDFDTPEAGTKWLVVNVSIKNVGTDPETVSSIMEFNLADDEGYKRDSAIGVKTEGSLDGTIAASMTMRGEEAYVVKDTSKDFTFTFEPGLFDTTQVMWDIPVSGVK